jgi:hypothetical protein
MKRGSMSDNSVVEGLHRASRQLRDQWMSESVALVAARASRGFERMADVQNKDFSLTTERLRLSKGTVRDPRSAELYEDPLLY